MIFFDQNVNIFPDDYVCDDNLPRISKDTHINRNGRALIDFCKETGMRIMNGRIGDEASVGNYTYVGRTGSSVVDYVICFPSIINRFISFNVLEPNILSDLRGRSL